MLNDIGLNNSHPGTPKQSTTDITLLVKIHLDCTTRPQKFHIFVDGRPAFETCLFK